MRDWLIWLTQWGTSVMIWAQSYRSPFLDAIFFAATDLGEAPFYAIVITILYWCVNRALGARLALLLLLSDYVNAAVKLFVHIPRTADPRIERLRRETSFSFPSGHAQSAMTFWGYVARGRRLALRLAAALLVATIAASRIYLGVHYPADAIGGIIFGTLVLLLFILVGERRILPWLRRQSLRIQLIVAGGSGLALWLLYPRTAGTSVGSEQAGLTAGSFLGVALGIPLERRYVRFGVAGSWPRRAARWAVGLLIVAAVYLLPWQFVALPLWAIEPVALERSLAAGLMLTLGAPWIFCRLGLAPREAR
jgi:membrane-associated phospholipid phosphatase